MRGRIGYMERCDLFGCEHVRDASDWRWCEHKQVGGRRVKPKRDGEYGIIETV